jgi:hypothetical protein
MVRRGGNLDAVAAAMDAAIARGTFHREGRNLFNSLRERVILSAGRPTGDTADLDRLVQRIRALRAKTVEQGCTEQAGASPVGRSLGALQHPFALQLLHLRG